MIVYTPAAHIWADANRGGIANVIAQALAKGQFALDSASLSSSRWAGAPSGTNNPATVSAAGPARFYRLLTVGL